MQKVVIRGPRSAELVEVADPAPKAEWAVVKIHAAPMCTEYKRWLGGEPADQLGHEAAGEVVAVAQPGRVAVGDRVVAMPIYGCGRCDLCLAGYYIHCEARADFAAFHGSSDGSATYAQYLLKPDWLLLPIPDGLSYDHAALACCALGPSLGAFEAMNLGASDTVLITGAGPVGLGAVVNATHRGARVLVAELAPWRAEKARQLGAETVLDPRDPNIVANIRDVTDGCGVNASLDCSGNVAAERLCIDATRRKGRVAFIGECQDDLAIRISPDMIRKGLTLIGSWHYNLGSFPHVMQVIQRSPAAASLISHTFPMQNIQTAFETLASQQTAKVVLHPWE